MPVGPIQLQHLAGPRGRGVAPYTIDAASAQDQV